MKSCFRLLFVGFLIFLALTVSVQAGKPAPLRIRPATAPLPQYTVTDLGALYVNGTVRETYAYGICETGIIFGQSQATSSGYRHLFRWTPTAPNAATGTLADLGTLIGTDANSNYVGYSGMEGSLNGNTCINASGTVVGISESVAPPGSTYTRRITHGVRTAGNALTDLGFLSAEANGYSLSRARAINASGQTVGLSSTTGGGGEAFLSDETGMHSLGILRGLEISSAYGINASGEIVGYCRGYSTPSRAFLYRGGVMADLGSLGADSYGDGGSQAFAINDAGQVAGVATLGRGGVFHGFLWTPGGTNGVAANPQMKDLGFLGQNDPASYAYAITPSGIVTGQSWMDGIDSQSAQSFEHGFWYEASLHDIGSLALGYYATDTVQVDAPYSQNYYNSSKVRSCASVGNEFVAVGNSYAFPRRYGLANTPHAFVFRQGLMYDLNRLLTGANIDGVTLDDATGINRNGQIVANGTDSTGSRHAYLLSLAPGIPASAPSVRQLYPTSCLSGQSQFTLAVNGAGFDLNSRVVWNGAPLTTSVQSENLLLATVPAALVDSGGQVAVTVDGNGGSNAQTFTVLASNPTPVIDSLDASPAGLVPSTIAANPGVDVTVTINGTGFLPGTQASYIFSGVSAPAATTYVSATQLTAVLPAAALTQGAYLFISVRNPPEAEGYAARDSNAVYFIVTNPRPSLSSISPGAVYAGSPGLTLHLTGTNFLTTSRIDFGTLTGFAPTYATLTSTQMDVSIPASAIRTARTVPITVVNVMPGGGTSASVDFVVQALAADVSSQVQVKRGGFRYNRTDNTFVQQVTLTNRSGSAVSGPVFLALDNVYGNLVNRSGVTALTSPPGLPYILVTTGAFPAGASLTVTLQFLLTDPGGVRYTTHVLAGSYGL